MNADAQEPKHGQVERELAELMERAERGQLTPEGFKRCEELIAESPHLAQQEQGR